MAASTCFKLLATKRLVNLAVPVQRFSAATQAIEKMEGVQDDLFKTIELEMRGHDPAVLKSYSKFINYAANNLGIEVGKSWTPQKATHERLTVLRSIHVNKKCRVQYETRTYYTFLQIHKLTSSTSDTYLEYIQRNLPEGVAMKVTKVKLELLPDHLKPPSLEE